MNIDVTGFSGIPSPKGHNMVHCVSFLVVISGSSVSQGFPRILRLNIQLETKLFQILIEFLFVKGEQFDLKVWRFLEGLKLG